MISNRVSNLSSSTDVYNLEKKVYEDALRKVGYNGMPERDISEQQPKKKRTRQILWFNPPISEQTKRTYE